jgi:hypothetical protein
MNRNQKVKRREKNKQFIRRIDLDGFSCYAANGADSLALRMPGCCCGTWLRRPSNMPNSGIRPAAERGARFPAA